jgi:hypothetical protein
MMVGERPGIVFGVPFAAILFRDLAVLRAGSLGRVGINGIGTPAKPHRRPGPPLPIASRFGQIRMAANQSLVSHVLWPFYFNLLLIGVRGPAAAAAPTRL